MKKLLLATALLLTSLNGHAQKYVGGDISMLTKYEDAGVVYKDKNGTNVEPLKFFKDEGWNAMRVRLFVDPSKASTEHKREGVVQDLDYVIALSKRIKAAGFSLMLDFHYSDTWTDPGKHSTPSAWSSLNVADMTTKIYEYTKDCLQQLNAANATPDFIQPGNEITYGMLWPTAHIWPDGGGQDGGTWANFTGYLESAIKACNEVCPKAKIVIQTEMSKASNVTNFYKELAKYPKVKYDIIGLSYYPDYHGTLSTLENCISSLELAHADKDIMIVETGYSYAWHIPKNSQNLESIWPLTEEGQRKFTADLVTMLNKHAKVTGLYWWWPEDNGNKSVTTNWWNAALFDHNTGKPYAAFYELKNFLGDDTGISSVSISTQQESKYWYTLDGRRLSSKPWRPGIYIHAGKKMIVK